MSSKHLSQPIKGDQPFRLGQRAGLHLAVSATPHSRLVSLTRMLRGVGWYRIFDVQIRELQVNLGLRNFPLSAPF
jgi:hypothetical protein